MLLYLSALALAATVHVESDTEVAVQIGDQTETIKARRSEDFKRVDEGTHAVAIRSDAAVLWEGELGLPDKAEVWLGWRDGALVLLRADREVSSFEKASNTAMAVGAGAQAASDVAGAASGASADMQAAARGEATQSSRTEIQVAAGPGGVSSSTSRTTAGASGVHSNATATSIGPDGVSRSTGSLDVDGSGVQASEGGYAVSRVAIPGRGDLVVTLLQKGGGGSVASQVSLGAAAPPASAAVVAPPATATAPAAVAAPPATATAPASAAAAAPPPRAPAAPVPVGQVPDAKTVVFREPASLTVDGSVWRMLDPVAETEFFKLQVRVAAPADRGVLWQASTATLLVGGKEVAGQPKLLSLAPGQEDKLTAVFKQPGVEHRSTLATLRLGDVVALEKGTAFPAGSGALVEGDTRQVGPLACVVRSTSFSKKTTGGELSCTNGGPEWVLVEPASVTVEVGTAMPNAHRRTELLLIGPGESEVLSVEVPVAAASASVSMAGAVYATTVRPLALPDVALEMDADASK